MTQRRLHDAVASLLLLWSRSLTGLFELRRSFSENQPIRPPGMCRYDAFGQGKFPVSSSLCRVDSYCFVERDEEASPPQGISFFRGLFFVVVSEDPEEYLHEIYCRKYCG